MDNRNREDTFAPLNAEKLLQRINALYPALPPAQQKAILFIRKKWDQLCLMTAKEVGKQADVSEATVQRIAIGLGFKSFRDMKLQMKSNMLKNRAPVNFKLKEGQSDTKTGWIESFAATETNNLAQTLRLNAPEAIEAGARLLHQAARIWVIGDKMGSGVSEYLRFTLNYLIGKTARIDLADFQEYLSGMGGGDVLVAVGFQRYCQRTLKIAKHAKAKGAKLLVFTDCDLSPFAKPADVALYAQTESVVFLDSYAAVLSLAQALIAQVIWQNPQAVRQGMERNEEIYHMIC